MDKTAKFVTEMLQGVVLYTFGSLDLPFLQGTVRRDLLEYKNHTIFLVLEHISETFPRFYVANAPKIRKKIPITKKKDGSCLRLGM